MLEFPARCWSISGPVVRPMPGAERVHAIARDYKVCQINIDNNSSLAARYQVNAVPTLLIFKSGQVKKRIQGAVPETHLRAELDRAN